MDRRLVFTGGEINPTNDELNLMPDSNRGGIHALGSAITNGSNAILQGVNAVVGASSVTFSDGYVFLNGEVLKVVGDTVSDAEGNDLYIFEKQSITNDPAFVRNYRDGSSHNVAEINTAIVVSVTAVAPGELAVVGNRPKGINVINVGFTGPLDVTQTGSFPVGGDVVSSASFDSTPNSTLIEVTFANSAPDLNYFVRMNLQSTASTSPIDEREMYCPTFLKVDENTIRASIAEGAAVGQELVLWFEMVVIDFTAP